MAKPVSSRGLARQRVLAAALELFAEHGVHGTSLQMIADRVGVGKAAVYYQFRSKEDILVEVLRPSMDDMAQVVRIAEALPDWESRRAVAISGLVDMAVRHRHLALVLHGDPGIGQFIMSQPEMAEVNERLRQLLEGPHADSTSRVAFSVFVAGVGRAAADPELTDMDDEILRRTLLEVSQRIMQTAHQRS